MFGTGVYVLAVEANVTTRLILNVALAMSASLVYCIL